MKEDTAPAPELPGGEPEEKWEPYNPCAPCFRQLIGQILERYELPYRDMCLVLVDTDHEAADNEEAYLVAQLLPGLNECRIYTDRPEYFASFAEETLRESGLMTEVHEKAELGRRTREDAAGEGTAEEYDSPAAATSRRNLVLDCEKQGSMETARFGKNDIYIPVYKRQWQRGANLDISVPIGYNTVIVKGVETEAEETSSDWLEREFYAE